MVALVNEYISAQLISSFGHYIVHPTVCWESGIIPYSQYPLSIVSPLSTVSLPISILSFSIRTIFKGRMSTEHKDYISQLPLKLGVTG